MRDLVRESPRNLLEELEDPGDLLARPTGKNSTVRNRALRERFHPYMVSNLRENLLRQVVKVQDDILGSPHWLLPVITGSYQ